MEIVFNDISVTYQKENKFEVVQMLEKFVSTILELEKNKVRSNLLGKESLRGKKLCPDYCLEQLYNETSLKADIRRVILNSLAKMKIINIETNAIFTLDSISSDLCAWAAENKNILISLDMNESLKEAYLTGTYTTGSTKFSIKIPNLCEKQHIYTHKYLLDLRVYEQNPKHKINYGWGSPMDLSSIEAQTVLEKAIMYEDNKNCLVNKYKGKFYVFRRHIDNCYHGYIDNAVPENIKAKFS